MNEVVVNIPIPNFSQMTMWHWIYVYLVIHLLVASVTHVRGILISKKWNKLPVKTRREILANDPKTEKFAVYNVSASDLFLAGIFWVFTFRLPYLILYSVARFLFSAFTLTWTPSAYGVPKGCPPRYTGIFDNA